MLQANAESTNLDLLRSSAVAFVVVSHLPLQSLGFAVPAGYQMGALGLEGVLIFFVHTSLVLMLSLERQREQWGARRMVSVFLIRRIFRIYPLSICAVLVAQALWMLGIGAGFEGHLKWLAWDVLLVQNITATVSRPAPLWSLPFEMQMYFFLPALFLIVRSFRRAPIAIFGLWLVSMMCTFALYRLGWRYDLTKYVPCFLPGILAYALSRRALPSVPAIVLFAFVGLLAVVYPVLVAHGIRENLLGPFACLALGLLVPMCNEVSSPALARIGKVVAKYSYGVYLTHAWAIDIAFEYRGQTPLALRLGIFALALCLFAFAAYHLIEAPGLRLGKRLVGSMRARLDVTSA